MASCRPPAPGSLGLPLYTTHVNGGALFGVGLGQKNGAMDWGVVRNILLFWAITLPAGMAFAFVLFMLLRAAL